MNFFGSGVGYTIPGSGSADSDPGPDPHQNMRIRNTGIKNVRVIKNEDFSRYSRDDLLNIHFKTCLLV